MARPTPTLRAPSRGSTAELKPAPMRDFMNTDLLNSCIANYTLIEEQEIAKSRVTTFEEEEKVKAVIGLLEQILEKNIRSLQAKILCERFYRSDKPAERRRLEDDLDDVLDANKGSFQLGTPEYEALLKNVKIRAANKALKEQNERLDALRIQMTNAVQEKLHWEWVQQRIGSSRAVAKPVSKSDGVLAGSTRSPSKITRQTGFAKTARRSSSAGTSTRKRLSVVGEAVIESDDSDSQCSQETRSNILAKFAMPPLPQAIQRGEEQQPHNLFEKLTVPSSSSKTVPNASNASNASVERAGSQMRLSTPNFSRMVRRDNSELTASNISLPVSLIDPAESRRPSGASMSAETLDSRRPSGNGVEDELTEWRDIKGTPSPLKSKKSYWSLGFGGSSKKE